MLNDDGVYLWLLSSYCTIPGMEFGRAHTTAALCRAERVCRFGEYLGAVYPYVAWSVMNSLVFKNMLRYRTSCALYQHPVDAGGPKTQEVSKDSFGTPSPPRACRTVPQVPYLSPTI